MFDDQYDDDVRPLFFKKVEPNGSSFVLVAFGLIITNIRRRIPMLVTNQIQFDQTRPVRETIRATGRTVVTATNAICNGISMLDDVIVLARETIRESLIEAKIDSMQAELKGMQTIAELEAQLKEKRAQLAKA